MIKLPEETCFGCYGCSNVCPRDAITMTPDRYGYKHPKIDPGKCVECHLCERVCTSLHHLPLLKPEKVLAAVVKDNGELQTVASGGVCTELARLIVNNGGVAYGCSQENYMSIHHVRVDNLEDLELLKKSKYVYSDIADTYSQAKADLDTGRMVVFTGTPCQISGLLGFLRKPYENLLTVDLICHGVPSQKMLQDHISTIPQAKFLDKTNLKVDFRWKSRYGIRYGIRFGIRDNEVYEKHETVDPYMAAFHAGISYRENCFSCPFATDRRVADITAADFWGIGKLFPSKFKDINGVSMVLLNTQRGLEYFNQISSRFDIEEHTIEEAKMNNANLSHPSPRLSLRDKFLELYATEGIGKAAYECLPRYRKNTSRIYRFLLNVPGLTKLYNIFKTAINKLR